MNKKNKKKGFTLAEVLITLTIIGAVASLTIPSLINNISDQQYRTALKRNFANFSQLHMKIQADFGSFSAFLSDCSTGDHTCFKNKLKPYLNYIKECDTGATLGNCFPASNKYLNGDIQADTAFRNDAAGLILADGAALDIYLDSTSCISTRGSLNDECGWVTIDVNGLKEPNTRGKDIYTLLFYKSGLKPLGTQNDGIGDDCNVSSSGYGCAAQYLYQ